MGFRPATLAAGTSVSLSPSGDTTGVTDVAAIRTAIANLPASGGIVQLAGGNFYTNSQINITKPCIIQGLGTGADFDNVLDILWNPATQIIRASNGDTTPIFNIVGPAGPIIFNNIGMDGNNLAISGIIANTWQAGGGQFFGIRRTNGYCMDLGTTTVNANVDTMGLSFNGLYLRGGGCIRLTGNAALTANCTHNVFERVTGLFYGQNDRTVADGAITTGTNSFSSATAAFTQADVGKTITVAGAGTSGSLLATIIQTVSNATTVLLAINAGTTVAAASTTISLAGIDIENGDNNDMLGCWLFRETTEGSLGYGLWIGHNARGNYFQHIEASTGGMLCTVPSNASYNNTIFGYDQNNGEPLPAIMNGASLTYTSDGQNATTGWNIGTPGLALKTTQGGTAAASVSLLDTATNNKFYFRNAAGPGLEFLNNAFTSILRLATPGLLRFMAAGGGTDTSVVANFITPTFANGTAAQLSDTTRDYVVYLTIGTAGTALTIAIGPTAGTADTVINAATAPAGACYTVRLPAGWFLKWTATTATLNSQQAVSV